jgi:hypothetical protein
MRAAAVISSILCVVGINIAAAQQNPRQTPPSRLVPDTSCTPDTREIAPPTVGSGNPRGPNGGQPRDLSDRLAESKGVICPPRGVDPEIELTPPPGGDIKIIPAPGSPGGNPNVQPK